MLHAATLVRSLVIPAAASGKLQFGQSEHHYFRWGARAWPNDVPDSLESVSLAEVEQLGMSNTLTTYTLHQQRIQYQQESAYLPTTSISSPKVRDEANNGHQEIKGCTD